LCNEKDDELARVLFGRLSPLLILKVVPYTAFETQHPTTSTLGEKEIPVNTPSLLGTKPEQPRRPAVLIEEIVDEVSPPQQPEDFPGGTEETIKEEPSSNSNHKRPKIDVLEGLINQLAILLFKR